MEWRIISWLSKMSSSDCGHTSCSICLPRLQASAISPVVITVRVQLRTLTHSSYFRLRALGCESHVHICTLTTG